jgi:hypothetical protein
MARKYRKIDPRIWSDERFRKLSPDDKLFAFYVLTCPQANRVGLFRFSLALAAEDLGTSFKGIETRFDRVWHTLRWRWDADVKVVYLPTWWKYNEPENPKHVIGCLKDLDDIPYTAFIADFATNTRYLPDKVLDTFTQCMAYRMAHRMPYQEQEQEQEHEHEQDSGEAGVSIPASLNSGPFPAKWADWLAYRSKRKLSRLPQTLSAQLEELAPLGPERATECLKASIKNGWQGIFPEKFSDKRNAASAVAGPGQKFDPNAAVTWG